MPVLPQFSPQGTPTAAVDSYIEGVNARQSWMDRQAQRDALQQQTEQNRQLFEIQRPVMYAKHQAELATAGNNLAMQTQMSNLLTQANTEMPDIRSRWIDTNNINDPTMRLSAQEKILGIADKYASLETVAPEIKSWHEVYAQGVVNQRSREALSGKAEIAQLKAGSDQQIAQLRVDAANELAKVRQAQADERQKMQAEIQAARLELAQTKFGQAGDLKYREERGKQLATMVNDVVTKIPVYNDTLAQTARARALLDADAQQGRGAATILGVEQAINTFVPGLFDTTKEESLKNTYAEMALAAAAKMRGQGQITENERRLLADTVTQYGNTPQGARAIMDFMDAIAKRELDRAQYFSDIEGQDRMVTTKDNLDFYAQNPIQKYLSGDLAAGAKSPASGWTPEKQKRLDELQAKLKTNATGAK